MPISIKTDLEIGQVIYLKIDPYQEEYQLVGVMVVANKGIRFRLGFMGNEIEVWDFECSLIPDKEKLKKMKGNKDEEEEDDE